MKKKIDLDIFIVVSPHALDNVELTIRYLKKNVLNLRDVYLVTAEEFVTHLEGKVKVIDENSIGIDKNLIADWFNSNGYSEKRVNWYFQQFLKIQLSNIVKTKYYAVWDGDTIPLKKMRLIKQIGDEVCFLIRPTNEYHIPYFKTNLKLIKLKKIKPYSFISEYAVIKTAIGKSLINEIRKLSKKPWYINVLENINSADVNFSGFSEYEILGNYQASLGQSYELLNGKSFRKASSYFGKKSNQKILNIMSKYYLFISFESWGISNEFKAKFFKTFPIAAIYFERIIEPLRKLKRCLATRYRKLFMK